MIKNIITTIIFLLLLLSSCASRKDIVYYNKTTTINDTLNKVTNNNYEPKFKSDDLLTITVTAPDVEAAVPFNLIAPTLNTLSAATERLTYLVDNKGYIEFPVIGHFKIEGYTREEIVKKLTDEIKKYINNPTVNIKILNFKICINGEVNRPGVYTIASERITLLDAISLGGDLTVYGRRDNILILREINGVKTMNRVDLTKTDFINSDFYYLSQNDQIYIEPNKTRINSSVVGPNVSIIISVATLMIAVVTLMLK
jgi:polysaccharide export outer membrane protein